MAIRTGTKKFFFANVTEWFPFLAVIYFLLCFVSIVNSQELSLTTPLQTQCNIESVKNWDNITNNYYGVAGTGFIGKEEWIGLCAAKYQWGGPWKPIDGYKHTLCGYLSVKKNKKGTSNYHLISDGDGDMVFYVIPDPEFRWLQFKSLRPQGHYFKDFSIACEVALKESGKDSASSIDHYFQNKKIDSIQLKPVGVYGPWVSDVHHQNSPEIHPMQQFWMTETKGAVMEYQLYSVLDNSERFDEKNNFNDTCSIKTWTLIPLINVFYIPFTISINDDAMLVYEMSMPSANNIIAYDSSENKLRLMVNGKQRLVVVKPGSTFPKITFTDVCQHENKIQGYIAIETSIGKLNVNSGGHAILKMKRRIVLPDHKRQ